MKQHDNNEALSQHDRDSRELRELCKQRDAARVETNRIIALLDAANDERKALRAEVERLRAREKACSTVNEGECIALVRMGQELAEAMGLNPLTASPADIVAAARKATP